MHSGLFDSRRLVYANAVDDDEEQLVNLNFEPAEHTIQQSRVDILPDSGTNPPVFLHKTVPDFGIACVRRTPHLVISPP